MDRLKKDFSKAALSYDKYSYVQRAAGSNLLDRLKFFNFEPQSILDLGCGTGFLTNELKQVWPRAKVTGVDIAPAMCEVAAKNYKDINFICQDIYALDFRPNSQDLIVSNFTLQWCADLPRIFQNLLKIARPDAMFIFATVGLGSLQEIRESWAKVDRQKRLMDFLDMHDIGDMLLNAGWRDPVIDVERFTNYYSAIEDIFSEFKALGVTNKNPRRPRGLTGKAKLAGFKKNYESLRTGKGLPLSWEVIYGSCRKASGVRLNKTKP